MNFFEKAVEKTEADTGTKLQALDNARDKKLETVQFQLLLESESLKNSLTEMEKKFLDILNAKSEKTLSLVKSKLFQSGK